MQNEQSLHILIADTSDNSSEDVLSLLDKHGYTCKSHRVNKEAELYEALREKKWDIVLLNDELTEISVAGCVDWIERLECNSALLVLTRKDIGIQELTQAYIDGVAGVVSLTAPDFLLAVFAKEFDAAKTRKQRVWLAGNNQELVERCRLLLSSSREAVAYIHQGMHIYANDSYIRKFNFKDMEEVSSMPFVDMVNTESRKALKECLKQVESDWKEDEQNKQVTFDIVACKNDGAEFNAQLLLEPTLFEGEKCLQVFVSTEKENQKKLNKAVKLDFDSGLFNRQFFLQKFDRLLHAVHASQIAGGMLLYIRVKMDDQIRSEIGFEKADMEMSAFTKLLKQHMNDNNLIARFGDNDFIILLPGDYKTEKLKQEIENWQKLLLEYKFESLAKGMDNTLSPSCNVISIEITKQTKSIKDVLTKVYQDLNEAYSNEVTLREGARKEKTKNVKNVGSIKIELEDKIKPATENKPAENNISSISSPNLENVKPITTPGAGADVKNVELNSEDMIQIIKSQKIKLEYEAVIAVADIETEFNEVKVVLDDQRFTDIASKNIYSMLNTHPSGIKFDKMVLELTLQVMTDLYNRGQTQHFCVTLNANSFKDEKFVPWLQAQIVKQNLDNNALIINVQQEAALIDMSACINFLNQLKEVGINFCVSEFIYSDAINNVINKRKPKYIKLADQISSNITENEGSKTDIQDLIERLHDSDITIIAGQVDDSITLSAFWVSNIDLMQGKYFQKEAFDLVTASFNEDNFEALKNIA